MLCCAFAGSCKNRKLDKAVKICGGRENHLLAAIFV